MEQLLNNEQDLPVLITGQLEGNMEVELSSLQIYLSEYTPSIITMWWIVWAITLLYLFLQYVVSPLVSDKK